jgi:pimeloyl-ACP methyl ester carboxylesterase
MACATQHGQSVYYETHGQGRPVVLVHGMFGNHAAWYQQVDALSSEFRVITLDLPGFGLSPRASEQVAFSLGEAIEAVVESVGLERIALVGQSFGGNAALAYALEHTDAIDALVLAGSLGGITLPGSLSASRPAQEGRSGDLLRRMFSTHFLSLEPEKCQLFLQLLSSNQPGSPPPAGRNPVRPTVDDLAGLARRVPTLFLLGEHDVVQPLDVVAEVARLVPEASLSVIEGAGHSAYFESPAIFNERLSAFLRAGPGERIADAAASQHSAGPSMAGRNKGSDYR